jgi:transcriptional regulator with XRE-family HTH domain
MLGLSQQAIAKWETGNSEPGNELLNRLASLFNISVDYLLGRTIERNPGTIDRTWPPEAKILFRNIEKLTPERLELVTKLVKEFIDKD